jgi:hypothetical protein
MTREITIRVKGQRYTVGSGFGGDYHVWNGDKRIGTIRRCPVNGWGKGCNTLREAARRLILERAH